MPTIFTIGHSNQRAVEFMSLIQAQNIECVVDVRSKPYSRFRHFNREPLEKRLAGLGIDYLYLGDKLGGHPDPDEFYEGGRVVYERVSALREFRLGIDQLVNESEQRILAIMCAEEDPADCHRHPLIARMLVERDLQVLHLRRDGTVQEATKMVEQLDPRMPLFEQDGEDRTWVSPKRIRRKGHR